MTCAVLDLIVIARIKLVIPQVATEILRYM